MGEDIMILTSKLGRFEFDDTVLLSHAKLIRDTVMGQWFSPRPGSKTLHTVDEALEFMRQHPTNLIAGITFDIKFPDDEHTPEPALDELPQPPLIPVPPIWIRQALVGDARPAWMDK